MVAEGIKRKLTAILPMQLGTAVSLQRMRLPQLRA
jgi:hypothetical protein